MLLYIAADLKDKQASFEHQNKYTMRISLISLINQDIITCIGQNFQAYVNTAKTGTVQILFNNQTYT